MSFTFNALELCFVIINEKPWTRAWEMCKTIEYGKATKTVDVVRHLCNRENYTHKWELTGYVSETKRVDWPKDSQKYNIYTNEEGMYELLFSSQQPKAKTFRKHCCNVLFPHVWQQLSDKLHATEIKDLSGRLRALEFMNDAHQQEILRFNEEHKQTIEEKDASK